MPRKDILKIEQNARLDFKGFFGIYHVNMKDPKSVMNAFENLVVRMLEEEATT